MNNQALALAARTGDALRRRSEIPKEDTRTDSGILLSATLTLLFFIIGFTFSMAHIPTPVPADNAMTFTSAPG